MRALWSVNNDIKYYDNQWRRDAYVHAIGRVADVITRVVKRARV